MKRGEILRKLYEAGPTADGGRILEEGSALIADDLNALVNTYGADLPLLVACIKSSMPHWERHMGKYGNELCRQFMESMMTIDISGLHRLEGN